MVIGLDTSALTLKSTGTSRYIVCLLTELNKTGEVIKCFSPGKGFNIPALNYIPILKRGGIRRHLYRRLEISNEMVKVGVEFAIFPNYLMPLDYAGPSAIVIHDLSFISHPEFYSKIFVRYYTNQLRKILEKDPAIVTVSESSAADIHNLLGTGKRRIFIVQAYANVPDTVCKNIMKDDRPYFLYVGHLEPRKNLLFLIRNFIEWNSSNGGKYKLVIAGELWLNSKEVTSLYNRFELNPDIEFMGYVSEDDLHSLYYHASAFVHAGIVEGFGFPVLDAMNYSLPVLCSKGSGTEEISKPNALTFNPYDPNELKKGFDDLITLSKEKMNYNLKYSPKLMHEQLENLLDAVGNVKRISIGAEFSNVETAVEKTLLYYKIFNSGIEEKKLHPFLMEEHATSKQVNKAVDSLITRGTIYRKGDFLYLNYPAIPFYSKKNNGPNQKTVQMLLKFLKIVPFISSIAFSGGTAIYGPGNHDDIDLFIIAKPFTVYIVYVIIHIFSFLLKSRRILCTNYLIDEKALPVNVNRDIYTAHQIITLRPYKNESMMINFLNENKWVLRHYPNFEILQQQVYEISRLHILLSPINKILEKLYRIWYRKYIRLSRNNSVILKTHVIKLHTNDYRDKVITEFIKQWDRYNRSKSEKSVLV